MKKIGLVIDSTTVLDKAMVEKYQIEIVSLVVSYHNENYLETTLSDEFIIERLEDVKGFKTASPAPQHFYDAYQRLWDKGFEALIVIPLSKEISGTYQAAVIARDMDERSDDIHIIDTNICNFGNANLVETILPLFDSEMSVEAIVAEINLRALNSNVLFTVTDLKHLMHGGRLSKISAIVGSLLKIKPIIEMIDGKLKLTQKVRHSKAILEVFMQAIKKHVDNFQNVSLKIVYLQNEDLMNKLRELVKTEYQKVIISIIDRVNPVFLTHLGNNGIGIALTSF